MPLGGGGKQRDASVDRWVQNLYQHQGFDYDSAHDFDLDLDSTPPRVVKTIIKDSGNTQWPI